MAPVAVPKEMTTETLTVETQMAETPTVVRAMEATMTETVTADRICLAPVPR